MRLPKLSVAIIGAGSVGVTAALLFKKLGFHVDLIDRASHILHGAPQVTLIIHRDGLEYYHPKHRKTGEQCIDGAITKQLLFPYDSFSTNVCNSGRHIRFLLSKDAVSARGPQRVSKEGFITNAAHMQIHFRKRCKQLKTILGLSSKKLKELMVYPPFGLARKLSPDEYKDIDNIECGFAGSSVGANLPHFYAYSKALLACHGIKPLLGRQVTELRKDKDKYIIRFNGRKRTIKVDYVILCSSLGIQRIGQTLTGTTLRSLPRGRYFYNTMLFLRLRPCSDPELIKGTSQITFILQGKHGCAYTCLIPPTSARYGMGAGYYPTKRRGSQLVDISTNQKNSISDVERRLKLQLQKEHWSSFEARKYVIFKKARIHYKFLFNAEIAGSGNGIVFNPSSGASKGGKDRSVRVIAKKCAITYDRRVVAYHAPKWTNSDLTALMAVDDALRRLAGKSLGQYIATRYRVKEQKTRFGYGPTNLNIPFLARYLHFRDAGRIASVEDASQYAIKSKIDARIVDSRSRIFKR